MRGVLTAKSRAILEARYLHIDDNGNKESINGLFKRVSGGNEHYEKLMTSFDFMPNSPTLFNAHTGKKGTLSACVPAGEVICLNNKPVRVEDVVVGDDSLTHNGNVQQVAEVYSREYIGDVVVLTPYFLPALRLTPEHPVWARRSGRWANGHVSLEMAEPEWVHVGCLEPGDFVFMPTTHGQSVVDSDVAWLIGLYAADGYQPAENATIFCLNKNKDQKIADRVEQISRTFDVTTITRKERDNRLDVYIGSRSLSAYIRTLVHGKVGDKRLTTQAEGLTAECAASLIAGWQAGDGCASHSGGRGNIGATISKTLAWQLRNLSLRTAKPLSLLIRKARGHSKTAYLLIETPPKNIRKAEDGSGYWVRLRKVRREEYAGVVYNFEVPGDHSYTAGGIAVHNCFKFDVADSFDDGPDSIFATRRKAGLIAKWGGGVGYYLGNIRTKNSLISSVHRKACGPVAVLRDYQQLSDLITQGGKRALAQMGILPCWHGDIREFIHVKDEDPKKYCSFNISVSWIDKWMQEIKQGRPGEPLKLWEEQIDSAWKTGDPGVYFFDTSERANPTPWLGQLTGTNPSLRRGTRVYTTDGIRPIEELEGKSFRVKNLNGNVSNAVCFLSGQNKPLYRILLEGGREFYATAEHKWPVIDKHRRTSKLTTVDLKRGDYLPLVRQESLGFGKELDAEDGFFVGWVIADGGVCIRGDNGSYQINLTLSEEKRVAGPGKRLVRYLESKGCEAQFNSRSNATGSSWYELNTVNSSLQAVLDAAGFVSKEAGLPAAVWSTASEEFRRGMLDALFSADGSIDLSKDSGKVTVVFTSSQKQLAYDVFDLLGFYGVKCAIRETVTDSAEFPNGKHYDRSYTRYDIAISGMENVGHFKKVVTLTHTIKQAKLVTPMIRKRKASLKSEAVRVLAVEKTDFHEDVWDINVHDDSHCFVVSGCVTGNCGEVSLLNNEPCLTGDALVDTPSGLVPIRQLLGRGEFAVNTYEQIAVAGCRAVARGVKDTLRIVLDNGQTIRCTPNHKILTGGKYKTVQATASKLTKWKTAEEINVGDWIRISDKPTVIPLQRESLQDEMLGWLVGDGWHTQENQIGILFSENDKEAMERLMPVWDEFVERDYALQRQPTGVIQKACYKTVILEKFKSLGFKTGNATRKELPDYIFQAETYRQIAFLKGLFSADGCVKKAGAGLRNLITLSSSSRRLLEQVQVLLLRFGIQSRIQWTTFSSCDRNDQGQLQISGESALRYRDTIGFNLSAKNNAFEQGQRHNVNREFAKVIYIEPDEPEEVFDILMPERHHFLANGIVVHNCNLGSINLGNFVTKNREVNWTRLQDVVCLATRFLDDILDWNHFPVQETHDAAYRTRKLGLGVMGWADMLCLLHVHYDSPAAVKLAHKLMQFIDEAAYETSLQLAKEKGPYLGYRADQATTPPLRNATRTCIAPTGTIYIICGADGSGIEPHFELEWDRKTGEGIILHEKVNAIEESEGFIPKVANDIAVEWHIKHQAAFQKHTNLAVSKTINLPNSASRQDVADAYMMMWESGCKGGTIYRDRCREDQVLVKTGEHKQGAGYDTKSGATSSGVTLPDLPKADAAVAGPVYHPEALAEAINSLSPEGLAVVVAKLDQAPASLLVRQILKEWKGNPILVELATDRVRRKLPVDRQSITHKFHIVDFEGYLTIGLYDDGSPGEIFFKASKEGSTISGLLDSWAMAVSLSLQYGCPLDTLVRLNYGTIFEPRGITCNKDIPLCSSIADYVFRYMSNRFLHGGEKVKMTAPAVEPVTTGVGDGGGKLVLQAQATAVKKRAIKSGVFCPECHAECIYQGGCYECGNRCGFSRCG